MEEVVQQRTRTHEKEVEQRGVVHGAAMLGARAERRGRIVDLGRHCVVQPSVLGKPDELGVALVRITSTTKPHPSVGGEEFHSMGGEPGRQVSSGLISQQQCLARLHNKARPGHTCQCPTSLQGAAGGPSRAAQRLQR